jgi:hypothetical protein
LTCQNFSLVWWDTLENLLPQIRLLISRNLPVMFPAGIPDGWGKLCQQRFHDLFVCGPVRLKSVRHLAHLRQKELNLSNRADGEGEISAEAEMALIQM